MFTSIKNMFSNIKGFFMGLLSSEQAEKNEAAPASKAKVLVKNILVYPFSLLKAVKESLFFTTDILKDIDRVVKTLPKDQWCQEGRVFHDYIAEHSSRIDFNNGHSDLLYYVFIQWQEEGKWSEDTTIEDRLVCFLSMIKEEHTRIKHNFLYQFSLVLSKRKQAIFEAMRAASICYKEKM